ncbi:MAG: hypothetical protein AAGB15_09630 [Pseudomonadota bacterium]
MIRFAALLIAGLAASGCAVEPRNAVVPASVEISAPSQEVSEEIARFSGIWAGTWDGCLPGKLAVVSIQPTGAVQAYYAYGDCAKWNISQGGGLHEGTIDGDVLRLDTFRNGANVTYTLLQDGSLRGSYIRDGGETLGRFLKE